MPRIRVAALAFTALCPLALWPEGVRAQAPVPVASIAASTTPAASDLKTVSGHVYKNARVARVEPDGVTYFFAGGAVKIPFTDLPEETRRKYGYDPKKAAEFAAAEENAQEAAQRADDAEKEQRKADESAWFARYAADEKAGRHDSDPLQSYEIDDAKKRAVIDAKDLAALYDENELSADSICKGKVGKIRGQITDISRDMLGVPYVMLDHGVRCAFPTGGENQLGSLRTGQTVVIIGKIHGKTIGVVSMYRCTVF